MKTSLAISSAALAFAGNAAAFWRMPCRFQTGIGRLDPIVDRGEISGHVHSITGSSGFGFDATYESLTADGTCTACSVTQDHSAYWTPPLYFMYSNGTTVMVPQIGGMLAYYLPLLDNVKTFPTGFQMLAGNPTVRNFTGPFPDTPLSSWDTNADNDQFFLQQRALGFNCLNYAIAPEPSLYRHVLPSKDYMDANCLDGIRLELAFPSCGNGEVDSDDHKSHMAYPSLVKEGNCPDGYDVHYPFLFYETIFNTYAFAGEDGEFVLSQGDPVGTGYHGDFMMGWESEDFLQSAIDTCTNPSGEIEDCPLFNIQSDAESGKCTFDMPSELKKDVAEGPRDGLPVAIPLQYGPEEATSYPIAGRSGQPTTSIETTSAPATFSHPTVSYSPADPESTKSALGGIVVAKVSPTDGAESVVETPAAAPTSAPSYGSSSAADGGFVATSYITSGNTVMEIFITEVDVTVTATAAEAEAAPTPAGEWRKKRHMHRHIHGGRR